MNVDICIPTKRGVDPQLICSLKEDTSGEIHISTTVPLVLARKELIGKVRSDRFLFIDDDIKYCKGLIQTLNSYLSENVGAVHGFATPYGLGERWDKFFKECRPKSTIYNPERVMTSNTLIRTSLVRDWKPPLNISGCEDWHLTSHIREQGYLCLVVSSGAMHKASWSKVRRSAIWFGGAYVSMPGSFPTKFFFKTLGAILKYIIKLPLTPFLSFYTIYQNTFVLYGVLKRSLIR